ncbi:hypothetical protein [Micromonospora sp. WMMD737]|uniref:hypothetical protein n=1 Tax=Micromonospora sp. WMMD737 TaxID=3404113 RepID=UPI003B940F1D
MTDPASTIDGIVTTTSKWGVEITAPDGTTAVDECTGIVYAINKAACINRTCPGTAHVVYWQVQHGPWSDDLSGNAFGIRTEWPDGRIEYEPADSRYSAESSTYLRNSCRRAGERAVTVSRTEVTTKPHRWPTPAPVPKPTGFLTSTARPTPARLRWWPVDGWLFWCALGMLLLGFVPTPLPPAVEATAGAAGILALFWHVWRKLWAYIEGR